MKHEWVDLQVNGYAGVDFNAPGLTVEAVKSQHVLDILKGKHAKEETANES